MNATSKIALAAALFTAIASPSFAGDQDLAALQAGSGRITGVQFAMPGNAYASATRYRSAAPQAWSSMMVLNDRLAQGHN